jgi:hypothetical protein
MTKEDKEQLNIEISHIFESGANHLRIFEMVENFIDKRYKAINYTHCCKSDSELFFCCKQAIDQRCSEQCLGCYTYKRD